MNGTSEPGGFARRPLLRRALGAGIVVAITSCLAMAADTPGVTIDNFKFAPVPLVVKAGTTVTWMNHDDIPHSVVIPSLQVKSHPMDTDESFAYKFDKAGTYAYICGLHPFMHGQVEVKP